jgi:predicted enzyme related to lactoylglutathione lyase
MNSDATAGGAFPLDSGWEAPRFGGEPYWLVRAGEVGEPGANSALVARGGLRRGPVLIAGAADMGGVIRRVESRGGKIVQGTLPVSGMVWSAYVLEPEGNTNGLVQPGAGARPLARQTAYLLSVIRPAARLTGCPCAASGAG